MHGYKWPINCTRTRTVRAIEAGEELLFDYGRAYWKKAYFFEHTQPSSQALAASPSADGVGEVQSAIKSAHHDDAVALALSGLAAGILREQQIDSVLARLRVQPPFVSQCYRYAAGGTGGDEGKAWYLLDEFGSRIRRHGAPVHGDGKNCASIAQAEPEPQPCEDASAGSSSNTCSARMAVYLDPEHGAFSVLWMETAGQAGDEVLLLDAN